MVKVEDVLKQALEMPTSDRALLAERLIRSLEPEECDPDVETAWQQEIGRRLDEMDRGEAEMIPWETVREQVRKSLRAQG